MVSNNFIVWLISLLTIITASKELRSSLQGSWSQNSNTIDEPPHFPSNSPVGISIKKQPVQFFAPSNSLNSINTDLHSDISDDACAMLKPCKNNGTCQNINTAQYGYVCLCPPGFNDTLCGSDHRLCKPHTCLNDGTCVVTSNITSNCICGDGWEDTRCQTMTNYCFNVTCQNKGVCRPLFLDYKCECVGGRYTGRHCEIKKNQSLPLRSSMIMSIGIILLLLFITFIW